MASDSTFAGEPVKEIGELDFLLGTFQGQRLLTLEELDLGDPGTECTVTETFSWAINKTALLGQMSIEVNGEKVDTELTIIYRDRLTGTIVSRDFLQHGAEFKSRIYRVGKGKYVASAVTETPKKDGRISTMQYAFEVVGPNVRSTQLTHIYTAGEKTTDAAPVVLRRVKQK